MQRNIGAAPTLENSTTCKRGVYYPESDGEPMAETPQHQQLMNKFCHYAIILALIGFGFGTADAQQNLAQQAYAIFQQNCLNCHGPHGAFTEQIVIDSASGLVNSGAVVPGNPFGSELYTRLLEADELKRMPLGGQLSDDAILTIGSWIQAGALSWEVQHDVNFISTDDMLTTLQDHLNGLDTFDRPFARYFTMTHLYNAGEDPEALAAYQVALSKLVNSLSWGFQIINPQPIDATETIFYIDLRDYEWDTREAWTQIEAVYPYLIDFDERTQANLHSKLASLRQEMACEVPFVYADWFLATASLPPLYHDILALPETEQELERELGIDVARNLQSAPGIRVWRAGTNDSGVSNHNRVVERHTSRYGAYWKSHDFASSVGAKNIFTHPLSFDRDGGEVIFNLPNGLQAYYISDALGNRIDVAPTDIVSNPGASDPAVRNGISCIGCHTEGMKAFEDGVRSDIEQTTNPAYDKDHALRLYVEKAEMDEWVSKDTQRYRDALEATGGVFGGIEPVHRFYEAFQDALDAEHAAAAVGLETEAFRQRISQESSLQNLGLTGLLSGGNVKRDVWTDNFEAVVACLYGDECLTPGPIEDDDRNTDNRISGGLIPDSNLRAVIAERLGKAPASITEDDLARLTELAADEKGIRDLTGLEHALRLERIEFRHNAISDLSPLTGLVRLNNIKLRGNRITDVSPLAKLVNVDWLGLEENAITDLSPLKGLVKLNGIGISDNPVSDVSALASLISLEGIDARRAPISDFSALATLPRLQWIEFGDDKSISQLPSLTGLKTLRRLEINNSSISDISGLAELTQLISLQLNNNSIEDVSSLAKLTRLESLELNSNVISDVSALAGLTNLEHLHLSHNVILDVSALAGLTNLEHLSLNDNAISDFSPLEELAEKIVIRVRSNPGALVQGGPKITGPWLWMLFPDAQFEDFRNRDLLADASGREVTELQVATNGATAGQSVGDKVWVSGKVGSANWQNISQVLRASGTPPTEDKQNVVYGSITLNSPREQQTKMFAGSGANHKVWLNGELLKESHGWSEDYQEFFPVTLKQGENVLLVSIHNWNHRLNGHFGFAPDTQYTLVRPGPKFSLSAEKTRFEVGSTFTVQVKVENVTDLAGWQTDIVFDPAVMRARKVTEGDFLKQDDEETFFKVGEIKNVLGKIIGVQAVRRSEDGISGQGTLLSVRFLARAAGKTRLALRSFYAGSNTGEAISASLFDIIVDVTAPAWDVNEDGVTNADDVKLVREALGQSPPIDPRTDVNGDGVVNSRDIAIVTAHLGEGTDPAAPANAVLPLGFTRGMVEQTLDILRRTDDGSLMFQRGIANLERLLASFLPEETALLPNYPNPFNPETWIPYQLAEAAEVTFRIYTANGALVRTLDLGYQPAGIYRYRSRAAYWDGKNEVGEPVASGIYFYTLSTKSTRDSVTAGDFTATRKMLIRK